MAPRATVVKPAQELKSGMLLVTNAGWGDYPLTVTSLTPRADGKLTVAAKSNGKSYRYVVDKTAPVCVHIASS